MKHIIKATRTATHIEFRNFPPDCGWFDPIDDLMFFPLNVPNIPSDFPSSMGDPEYILLHDVNGQKAELYDDRGYHRVFYGLRWDIRPWGSHGRKLAWAIYQYIKERFSVYSPECEIILTDA